MDERINRGVDGWVDERVDFGWLERQVELPDLGKQAFRLGSRSSKEAQHFCL